MRRAAIPVALSVLMVLAGCIGGGATAPDERTTEPTTAEPADPTTAGADGTTTDESATTDGEYPPGVTADGVENLSALLRAHGERLVAEGFVLRTSYEVSGEDGYRVVREATVEAGLDRARAEIDPGQEGPASETWVNATMMLNRVSADGEVEYHGRKRASAGEHGVAVDTRFTAVNRLDDALEDADLEVVNVTGTGDGRETTLRTADSSGVSATLVVDATGVVTSAQASGTRDRGEFTFEYDLQRLGVDDVEPPAWLDDAPAIVDADLNFDFENCTDTYLELDHQGGDALPAGSTITVDANDETHRVTLEEALDDGTRYLYVDANGELRMTATEPPADRGSVGNEVSVSVTTDDGYSVLSAGMGFGCESATEGGSGGGSSGSSGSSGSASE